MALDEPNENENSVGINGLEILMDARVKPYAEGKVLDYVKSLAGQGFTIMQESGENVC